MSDDVKFEEYLSERYAKEVVWYDTKSQHNQWWAKRYQISIIALSAITPVFAALEWKWITIVSSALAAMLVGVLKYCKYEELWHNYRTTCETLRKEKILFDNKVSPYDTADNPKGLFVERVESMISKENTAWVQVVTKKVKEKK
ncbi:MAG: DUF4231 domain-containing protein [Bacteroidota bacterium]